MPELPEVETITRKLKEKCLMKTIVQVTIENTKVIAYPDSEEFKTLLLDRQIQNINRRGKFIIFELDSNEVLVAHMRMTGRLYAVDAKEPFEKHTHLEFILDDGTSLRFVDPRRFGRFWLVERDSMDTLTGIGKLGVEPFSSDLTTAYLKEKLGKRKKAIKSLLLDQDIVAGIGNIYADEICHRCNIYPGRIGSQLSDEEFESLAKAIPDVLFENLEECLSEADDKLLNLLDYRNSKTITTYNHQNQPCPKCGTQLEKIKINGRASCYCPNCQKKDEGKK